MRECDDRRCLGAQVFAEHGFQCGEADLVHAQCAFHRIAVQAGDEVAAAALSQDRKFGVFTSDRATAFQLFMRDDQLHISFYAIAQPLEKPGVTDEIEIYKIPREFPTRRPRFALQPCKAQARTGARTLVSEWRSPVYRKALRLGRYGRGLRRRQVLM